MFAKDSCVPPSAVPSRPREHCSPMRIYLCELDLARLAATIGDLLSPLRLVLWAVVAATTTVGAQGSAPATLDVISIANGATRQIARLNADDRFPVWSPDSRRVALRTVRDGHTGIAVMNADGSGRRDFTTPGAMLTGI